MTKTIMQKSKLIRVYQSLGFGSIGLYSLYGDTTQTHNGSFWLLMDCLHAYFTGGNVETFFILLIKRLKMVPILEYIFEASIFLFDLPLSNAFSICKVVPFGRIIMAFPEPSII